MYATAISSVHLLVRLSVHHTTVLCQNDGTQKDAVFTIGQPSVSSFLTPRMVDGDDLVQVQFEWKEVDLHVKKAKLYRAYIFRLITPEP